MRRNPFSQVGENVSVVASWSCEQTKYPSCSAEALKETSGTCRLSADGTPLPVCQLGLGKKMLLPQPLAAKLPPGAVSFQAISGM